MNGLGVSCKITFGPKPTYEIIIIHTTKLRGREMHHFKVVGLRKRVFSFTYTTAQDQDFRETYYFLLASSSFLRLVNGPTQLLFFPFMLRHNAHVSQGLYKIYWNLHRTHYYLQIGRENQNYPKISLFSLKNHRIIRVSQFLHI